VGRHGRRGVAAERDPSAAAQIDFVSVNETAVRPSRSGAVGWTVVVFLTVAYAAIFAWLAGFSLQDYPNHLARAVVMSDLLFHGSERFGDLYQYHFMAVSYLLGDLLLTAAVELFGVRGATTIWIALVILSLPLALLFYLRGTRIAAPGRILILILSLYLSTDGFLFMGFLTFRVAIAITVVGLALVQGLRREWSARLYAVFCAVVVVGYLVHLSTLVFLMAAIAASASLRLWLRSTSVRKEAFFLIPVGVVALWQFGVGDHAHAANDLAQSAYDWGTWSGKLWRLQWEFLRYYDASIDRHIDKSLALAFAVCVLLPVCRQPPRAAFTKPAVLEMLILAAAFLGMYIALPSTLGGASYLDLRPLALVPIFLIMAFWCLPNEESRAYKSGVPLAIALAVLIASVNLAYLTVHFAKDNAWMARYRAIIAAVPKGARVLPMYPGTDQLKQFMHAASFAVIDRSAVIPYLFSGNRGNPQTYFRYTRMPYAPPESWYYMPRPPSTDVNWGAVACSYDFLLVMKPFELSRIHILTTPVAENASAALLAVTKHGCVST
jgi:hypothetical protein